jgi:hypothetical protein
MQVHGYLYQMFWYMTPSQPANRTKETREKDPFSDEVKLVVEVRSSQGALASFASLAR